MFFSLTECVESKLEQIRCALGLWFSHDANYWEPEIGLAWDLVCHLGFEPSGHFFFAPPQVDSIKAGAPPPPLLRAQLEELTMFSEAHARSSIVSNKLGVLTF